MNVDALRGALEAIDRVLNRGGDADDVLRNVCEILHDRAGYTWVGIELVEGDDLVLGPSQGGEPPAERTRFPVAYRGNVVAELSLAGSPGEDEAAFLERVATLISPYCLVGWDTGGERWAP
jgi:hypothetical protein